MKKLTCEMCGGTDIVKQDGLWVCQTCGCKYSTEEARKMMVEGTVDVSGSTIIIDNSSSVQKYLENARRAKQKEDWEEVEKYYNLVEQNDPSNIEAIFYSAYGKAKQALITNDQFKRAEAFKVLKNSISIIDDNFDILKELDNIEIIKKISDDIFEMQNSNFVYTATTHNYGLNLGDFYIPISNTTDNKNETFILFKNLHLGFIESLINIFDKYNDSNCEEILKMIPVLNRHAYAIEYQDNVFDIMYNRFPKYKKSIDYYYAEFCIAIGEYKKVEEILDGNDEAENLLLNVRVKRILQDIYSYAKNSNIFGGDYGDEKLTMALKDMNLLLEKCKNNTNYIEMCLDFAKALQTANRNEEVLSLINRIDMSQLKSKDQIEKMFDLFINGDGELISILNDIVKRLITNEEMCEYIYNKAESDYSNRIRILKLIPNYKDAIVPILKDLNIRNEVFCYCNNELDETTLLKAISFYIDNGDTFNLDIILSHYNSDVYKEAIYNSAKKMEYKKAIKFYKLIIDYKDSKELYEKIKKEIGILGKFL